MKTVIFSDTHIGYLFNQKKYNYLKNIISNSDRVILNGDFWDDEVPLAKFLSSKWIDLLKILQEKESIYIYGNHDKKIKDNNTIKQYFKEITDEFKFQEDNTTYIITHGNSIIPTLTETFLQRNDKNLILKLAKKIRNITYTFYYKSSIEKIPTKILKEHFYKIFAIQNYRMKKFAKEKLKENEFLICGHSHYAELDLKNKYANNGFINYGFAQHIEIENNEIKLIKDRY
ncbi:metallophosphoesterase family protein [Candidatus Woesearchaeota archaeon]|nr:metallophosphoesterase family protein [Candidatus Woesearchaeota archaeon]